MGGVERGTVPRLPNPWVGIPPGVDPVGWARLLRRAHDAALSRGATPTFLRDVVADSWHRATEAGVDPERPAPRMFDEDETASRLEAHPISRMLPLVESMLAEAAEDSKYLIAFSDADGILLWAGGHAGALQTAVAPRFLPGHLASEQAVGTNAVGTALAVDHAVQIFSAEHFSRLLHGWTCSAAPVRDPETQETLGVLNLSGEFRTGHPHSLGLVQAVTRMIESQLAREAAERYERLKELYLDRVSRTGRQRSALVTANGRVLTSSPRGWAGQRVTIPADGGIVTLPGGLDVIAEPLGNGSGHVLWQARGRRARKRQRLRLDALGRSRARLLMDGASIDLSRRHSEIMVLLVLNPRGLSCDELAQELHGSESRRVTVRAEVSRLRRVLGPVLVSNPYSLEADVRADFLEVERRIEAGDMAGALERYAGPLLPDSKIEPIVAARGRVERGIRDSIGENRDVAVLHTWVQSESGRDDHQALEQLHGLMDPGDPRRAAVASRLATSHAAASQP